MINYQFMIMGGVGDLYLNSINAKKTAVPNNVKLFGTVDTSLRDIIYKAADIAINPMFSGSGTNIKMFDYMAAGLPTITTAVGARGIDNFNDAFIICEAHDLVEYIKMVFESKEIYEKMSRNGRKLVENCFDWKAITDQAYNLIQTRIDG